MSVVLLRMIWHHIGVEHVEVGQRDIPSLILGDACDMDRVVPSQPAVRWIDVTCGEVHQRPVEFEDTIWMRGEERVVCQHDHPAVWCLAWRHNRFSTSRDAVGGFPGPEEVASDGVF